MELIDKEVNEPAIRPELRHSEHKEPRILVIGPVGPDSWATRDPRTLVV